MEEFYLFVLLAIFLVVFLLGPFLIARIKLKAEIGKHPNFQILCSSRIGLYGSNIPSTRVTVYEEFLVISIFWPKIIKYEEIEDIEFNEGFFSSSLKIERSNNVSIKLVSSHAQNLINHFLPYLKETVKYKVKIRYKLA